jgi:CDP-diacylglycerol--glycerol-3-phosphate 3-phosphatidyltransferase
MGLSSLISYERAKAESLGLQAKGGLMERAERLILLGFGLLFDSLLIPILWVMLGLTAFTAVQRFVKVWRQAVAAPVVLERQAARRSRRVARRTARAHRRTEFRRRRPRP